MKYLCLHCALQYSFLALSPCSQHRCPHQPHANIMNRSPQPCSFSEYTQQFKKYSVRPRKPIKPPQQPLNRDVKMECATINRQDFTPHPVTPRAQQPPAVYKPPEGTISSATEYKREFEGKFSLPAVAIRPPDGRKDDRSPFNHRSTQATDFVPFPMIPPRESFAVKRTYEPPKDRIDTKSTVQTDFVDFGPVEPAISLKPPQTPKLSTDPFDGTSCYRQTFTPQPIPERHQLPKTLYKPPAAQFDGSSTYKKDFPVYRGATPALSLRPPQKPVAGDSRFDGATTSQLSYRTWELPERHSRPPTIYSPPKEKLATQSTFQADYPDHGRVELTRAIRPPQKERDVTTPFEGLSTQKADFPQWDASQIQRSTPIHQGKKYEPVTEKFDAISTIQAHYKGTPGARASSTKPAARPYTSTDKMETSTMYRESFSRAGFKPCPALGLSKDPQVSTGYNFSHQNDITGHMYFAPMTHVSASTQIPEPVSA